jgi:hypothetical protein
VVVRVMLAEVAEEVVEPLFIRHTFIARHIICPALYRKWGLVT